MIENITSMSGYTEIDTDHAKALFCTVEINDGLVTLKFEDYLLADQLMKEMVLEQFIGLKLEAKLSIPKE